MIELLESEFVQALQMFRKPLLSLHLLGTAIGLGGATVADILFFRFLVDLRISRKEHDVLRILAAVVACALTLMVATGIMLFLADMERLSASPAFQFKLVALLVLTANGLLLHEIIAPKLTKLSFAGGKKGRPALRRLAFGLGAVSCATWYTIFFTATLKSLLPAWVGFWHLASAYALILACAAASSQAVMLLLARRGYRSSFRS